MKKYFFLAFLFNVLLVSAQNVGIGTSNPQNKLHVAGGFRLDTLTGVNGSGLLKHDANGVVYGIKFSANSNDVLRGDGTFGPYNPAINGALGWLLTGNSGTNPSTNFIGTTDDQPLAFRVNNIRHGLLSRNNIFFGSNAGIVNTGINNIAIGSAALGKNTSRGRMIAIGDSALYNNLGTIPDVSSATNNIAIGYKALYANVNGGSNIAIGSNALEKNLSYGNVGIGFVALYDNVEGYNNVAIGYLPLMKNTTGYSNCAVGSATLSNNTTGSFNVAIGANSMASNINGLRNTAVGASSLQASSTFDNSAFGYYALRASRYGSFNCGFGNRTLENNEFGSYNNAFGYSALSNNNSGTQNTAIGTNALFNNISGDYNTAVGVAAGANLPNNVLNTVCIGYATGWNTTSSNQVNIGNFSMTWIGGQTGWFHYSDRRIKNNIKEDVPGLAFITRLKPITYNVDIRKQEDLVLEGADNKEKLIETSTKDWEGKYDVEKIKMTGFFAQDVEDAAKSINYSFSGVHSPKNGGLYSLDYSAFVVPLVKAVQEQQVTIEKQQKLIDDLLKRVEALEKK